MNELVPLVVMMVIVGGIVLAICLVNIFREKKDE